MARRPRRDEPPEDGWDPEAAGGGGDGSFDDDSNEDPHEEADRRRFSSDLAYCPECGAEIHDSADICPKCFAWVTDETIARPPRARRYRAIVIWIVIAALLAGAGLLGLLRLLLALPGGAA